MRINDRTIKILKGKSRMWLAALAALLSLSAVSCTDDAIDTGGSSVTPDGKVLISLSVKVSSPEQVGTRATAAEEDQINALDILVFDADDKLSQSTASATFNGTAWKVALAPNPTQQHIYAIANLPAAQRTLLESQSAGTTFDAIRTLLTLSDVTAAGVSHPFMMFSAVMQTAISPTMGAKQIEMIRTVARIDVAVAGSLTPADFQLESVKLLNAAKKYSPMPATTPELLTGTNVIRYNEIAASNNSITAAIYCYENNSTATTPTQLLIKGRYNGANTSGYYLLNMVYSKNNTFQFDIKRNNKYTVTITKVNNPGYNTENEALLRSPSNDMITEIMVTDGEAHDIVSNGSFYLGFSNSECMIYTSEAHNDELIATFTHNAPSGVAQGTLTVEGTGLSLVGGNPFSTPNGTVQSGEIKVNVGANFISGNVIVRLGNLEKKIKVFRNARPLSYGGAFDLGGAYVYAQKLQTGSDTDWIKLSPNEDASVGEDEATDPDGSVHMQLAINLTLLGGADRMCDLMCTRSNHEGRVRVKVAQYAFDIFEHNAQINNTYVGTFHRWNQVGERVISMPNPGSIWVATVVAGQDFIKLALGGSDDPAFGTDSPGDAESYLVPGSSTTVLDITPGAPILFRVGMKTSLSSESAQPRYGLILVSHAGGTNRIFVRQGEAPDYVMRKTDPIIGAPNGEASISRNDRPFAVRFAPLNLTDPNGGLGRVDLKNNAGGFVQYPSLGGYHFQANKPYGWYPDSGSAVDWNLPGVDSEPCPPNYRRPQDGATWNPGFVNGSEMRQSLWYYPRDGSAESDYYNTIRGCLADGYFDRLPSTVSNIYGSSVYKSIIVGSRINSAFIGTIIFNPLSNASIFLPAAGGRGGYNGGNLLEQGESTYWWSSTPSTNNGVNTWYGAMTYHGNKFTFDNYASATTNGHAIRCVSVVNP